MNVEEVTRLIKAQRGRDDIPRESARFTLTITRLLARGEPVTQAALAQALNQPQAFVGLALQQLQQSGCEFNDEDALIGAALTLTPTRHQLQVNGVQLYAWCALDTLFIPAYIGKTAQVNSTCPATDTPIALTVRPDSVGDIKPDGAVLSIVTASGCTSGIDGTFCGQVHFFASRDAAQQWIGERGDFAVLTVAEAYELAQEVYIRPLRQYLND